MEKKAHMMSGKQAAAAWFQGGSARKWEPPDSENMVLLSHSEKLDINTFISFNHNLELKH